MTASKEVLYYDPDLLSERFAAPWPRLLHDDVRYHRPWQTDAGF
jgi:hypothetical protein